MSLKTGNKPQKAVGITLSAITEVVTRLVKREREREREREKRERKRAEDISLTLAVQLLSRHQCSIASRSVCIIITTL